MMATWTREALASNPLRLVRLKRIKALARAFDVPANPEALWSGNFLRGRPPEFFEPARKAIVADLQQFGLVKGQKFCSTGYESAGLLTRYRATKKTYGKE
jgi:hypothetical protein